ncbi:post-transcriptional regulator [Paenisporosarcina sp. NPDC076898]|uniref:post-transcriptional regulator n=2 Tax=unclassified Paenisporosarcina TaxID=2642018 RepID=UPI003D0897B7
MSTILPLPSQVKEIRIQYSYAKITMLKTEEEGSVSMSVKYEELFELVRPALESKVAEFKVYNYNSVTEGDIWNYCINKKWRKRDIQEMRVSEMVNDILETSPAQYMTHTQIEDFRTSNWFSELNQGELRDLMNTNVKASMPKFVFVKSSES